MGLSDAARRAGQGLLVLALVVVALWPISPAIHPLPLTDSGVFLYTARQMLDGRAPYRAVWDHKPPLIYLIDAAGLWLGGGSVWGVWLLEVIALWGAAVGAARLLRRTFGLRPAVFGITAWLAALEFVLEGGNLTEFYALPLQFGLLLLVAASAERPRTWGPLVLIGVLAGLLFFLRQNLIGLAAAVLIYELAAVRRDWRACVRVLGGAALGFGLVTALVVGYLAVQGALGAFWEAAMRYNLVRAADGSASRRMANVVEVLRALAPSVLVVAAIGGWGLALVTLVSSRPQRSRGERALLGVSVLALPIELLLTGLSGRTYPHYGMPWLPVMTVLGTYFVTPLLGDTHRANPHVDERGGSVASGRGAFLPRVALIGLLIAVLLPALGQVYLNDLRGAADRSLARDPVLNLIEDSTYSDDTLLLWGAETTYNFVSGRRAPTRYAYQYPLYKRGYQSAAQIDEFLRDVEAERPVLILDTSPTNPNIAPLDAARRVGWSPEDPAYRLLPDMARVFSYVEQTYVPCGTAPTAGGAWSVYFARERAPAACGTD